MEKEINSILEFLDLKNIKNNKLYFILRIVFSLVFALTLVLDLIITDGTNIHQNTYKEIYFTSLNISNYIFLITGTLFTFIIISIIGKYIEFRNNKKHKERETKKWVFPAILITLLVCWLPYILSYMPGGLFYDTKESYLMFSGYVKLSNHHPLLFSAMFKMFADIGEYLGNINIGLDIYTILQVTLMATMIAYYIYWLYKKGVTIKFVVVLTLLCAIFKLFPLYAISLWKDTPFAIAILFYTFIISKIVISNGKEFTKKLTIFQYVLAIFLVSFFRNNGIYIAIVTTFILILAYKNNFKRKLNLFTIIVSIEILLILIIQIPVYRTLKLQGEFKESVGIPIQQICYVIAYDGNVTNEQLEFINNIESIENIKNRYAPWSVDMIKFYEFNDEYLEQHKGEFIKTWLDLFVKNPKDYIKAYLLSTMGFWDVNRTIITGIKDYVCPYTIISESEKDKIKVEQKDYIKEITGESLREKLFTADQISAAVFGFIMIINTIYLIKLKKYKNIIILLPALLILLTVFIATPVAFSFRYISGVLFVFPFSFAIKYLREEQKGEM